MYKIIKNQLFTLVIVDFIKMNSIVLVGGKYINAFEKSFNVNAVDNQVFLKGISFKKKRRIS